MMNLKTLFSLHSLELSKKITTSFLVVSLIGLIDSVYLTTEHFTGNTINCNIVSGCSAVLNSPYSTVAGIPLALLGAIYYVVIFLASVWYLESKAKYAWRLLALLPTPAWIFSLWLFYLQAVVIKSFCQYCLLSFLTSTLLFIFSILTWKKLQKQNFDGQKI